MLINFEEARPFQGDFVIEEGVLLTPEHIIEKLKTGELQIDNGSLTGNKDYTHVIIDKHGELIAVATEIWDTNPAGEEIKYRFKLVGPTQSRQ